MGFPINKRGLVGAWERWSSSLLFCANFGLVFHEKVYDIYTCIYLYKFKRKTQREERDMLTKFVLRSYLQVKLISFWVASRIYSLKCFYSTRFCMIFNNCFFIKNECKQIKLEFGNHLSWFYVLNFILKDDWALAD